MVSDVIIDLVEQYGYFLFLCALGLGPFGVPVPGEVIVTTSGWLSSGDALQPWLVYTCLLSGLCFAVTMGYLFGRRFGHPLANKLRSHAKYARYALASERLFQKYGKIALFVGYLLPVVRYLVPVFAGVLGIPYKTFAAISYFGAAAWTLGLFSLGYFAGSGMMRAASRIDWAMIAGTALPPAVLITGIVLWRKRILLKKESGPHA